MRHPLRGILIATAMAAAAYIMRDNEGIKGIGAIGELIHGCVTGRFADCDTSFPGRMPFLAVSMAFDRLEPTAAATAEKLVPGPKSLESKVAIVTGPTRGLGLETAKVLLEHGAYVIFAARNLAKAEAVIAALPRNSGNRAKALHLELSDTSSVRKFASEFLALNLPLHILVNNGAIMIPGANHLVSKQGHEMHFAVNHLAHFALTKLLEPRLLESGTVDSPSRVLYLTTSGIELWNGPDKDGGLEMQVPPPLITAEGYNDFAALFMYCRSNVLKVFTAMEQQERWAKDGRAIAMAVHPGLIVTGLLDGAGPIRAAFYEWPFIHAQKSIGQGAAVLIHAALADEVAGEVRTNGTFYYVNSAPETPGKIGGHPEWFTPELAKESWKRTEALL